MARCGFREPERTVLMLIIKDNLNEMGCVMIQQKLHARVRSNESETVKYAQQVVGRMSGLASKTGRRREAAGGHRKLARTGRKSKQESVVAGTQKERETKRCQRGVRQKKERRKKQRGRLRQLT